MHLVLVHHFSMSFFPRKIPVWDGWIFQPVCFCSIEVPFLQWKRSTSIRSNHRRCFVRRDFLRNFVKITGRFRKSTISQNLQSQACSFIEKDTLVQAFSCESSKISKKIFFAEHFRATASEVLFLSMERLTLFIKTQLDFTESLSIKKYKILARLSREIFSLRELCTYLTH